VLFETRRDRKIDQPEIIKSMLNVSGQERNFSIRKIVNAAGDLHLLVCAKLASKGCADSSRFTLSATFSVIAKSIYSQPLFNSMDL
jgi:hypothetical protein